MHWIDLNGLAPLLALWANLAPAGSLPSDLRSALRQRLVAREFWEAQHRRVVADAIEALSAAGCQPLLFKGTALAWSHYPSPATRVRGDTDILVAERERALACDALRRVGFTTPLVAGGTTVTAEKLYQRKDPTGLTHDVDLHWRLSSSAVLGGLFSYAELLERSAPLDGFAPGARRTGDVDALLIACFHRRLHLSGNRYTYLNGVAYPTVENVIWLVDIDLLVRALDASDTACLVERARRKGLAAIVAEGLTTAREQFGTPVPDELLSALSMRSGESAADRYLRARNARRTLMNFCHTPGWAGKGRFARELAFPPAEYMRRAFARHDREPLMLAYGRRFSRGLRAALANLQAAR